MLYPQNGDHIVTTDSVTSLQPVFCVFNTQDIDNWAFDVFQINDVGEGHALKYVGLELLQKYDLVNKYKVSSLQGTLWPDLSK